MLAFLQNTITMLFRKSWSTMVMALILATLFFYTYNGWLIFLSFLYFIPATIIHFISKRWTGLLISLLSLLFSMFLLLIWGIALAVFPEPSSVHDDYASLYENRNKIESITGISIPEFTVDSSKITHMSQFDFEFTTEAVLKFKTLPRDKTFQYLDSLCELYTPPSVDTTQEGSTQPVSANIYWSKENNEYQFSIIGDPLKKNLHKKDAFFMLTIKKNSPYAELTYGNY